MGFADKVLLTKNDAIDVHKPGSDENHDKLNAFRSNCTIFHHPWYSTLAYSEAEKPPANERTITISLMAASSYPCSLVASDHALVYQILILSGPTIALIYAVSVWVTYALSHEFSWTSKIGDLLLPASWIETAAIACSLAVTTLCQDDAQMHISRVTSVMSILLFWGSSMYCIYKIRTRDVVGISTIPFYGEEHLNEKVVLITGANAGIGKDTAAQIASMGAKTIVFLCRSESRAQTAVQELVDRGYQKSQFEVCPCDLGDFASIRNAVEYLTTKLKIQAVDILINNAGLLMGTYTKSKDGYELMMQANHLGHFLLTQLLLDRDILRKEGSRIINLTSSTYKLVKDGFDFEDMFCEGERRYTMFGTLYLIGRMGGWHLIMSPETSTCITNHRHPFILIFLLLFNVGQYSQTKLANVLYSKELARRYPTLSVYAVHPGIVRTNVTSNMVWYLRIPNDLFSWYIASIQKTSSQGAYSSVFCAAAPMDRLPTSGSVIHNCKLQATTDVAESRSDAKRLWQVSEKITGLNQE
jgi:NAD(P)-dependent dehydrogenase (short-subunit alcohol dehydrogenase family)